jgi:hypothetical protein
MRRGGLKSFPAALPPYDSQQNRPQSSGTHPNDAIVGGDTQRARDPTWGVWVAASGRGHSTLHVSVQENNRSCRHPPLTPFPD